MSSLAVYRNEQHAIIRAMAVDSIPSCKPAQWQTQYSSGYVEDLLLKNAVIVLEDAGMIERDNDAKWSQCNVRIINKPVPRVDYTTGL